jgi:VanZ family protein
VLKNHKYFIFLVIWLGVIFTLSLFSFKIDADPKLANEDKIAHLFFYFVLTILLIQFFKKEISIDLIHKNGLTLGIILAFTYGTIIEFLQWAFTTTRSAEWNDVLANSLGILIAVVFLKLLGKLQKS